MTQAMNDDNSHRWTTFQVDNETYAIDVMSVKEVLRYTQTTEVPGSADAIIGIFNLRGMIVTAVDTRAILKLPSKPLTEEDFIIVMEIDKGEYVGFVVENVEHVIDINQESIAPPPNGLNDSKGSEIVSGVAYLNERLIILADKDKMIQKARAALS